MLSTAWFIFPLVFSATGGMGRKVRFRLAVTTANKTNDSYYLDEQENVNRTGVCLRGSKIVFSKNDLNINEDITVSLAVTNIEN